ncbi:hypothetical protein E2562_029577 [Oryza meyeriana var. granulata]|uniref:Uncharacterized protein n=1 Tax=Oryza meyeriana var. granulata TaxID=110450 RepID=A0A6G1C9M9_9ORYZ|nr:hypothetical protein E2562_029577 [Oryza meyeriana var. granulata]
MLPLLPPSAWPSHHQNLDAPEQREVSQANVIGGTIFGCPHLESKLHKHRHCSLKKYERALDNLLVYEIYNGFGEIYPYLQEDRRI